MTKARDKLVVNRDNRRPSRRLGPVLNMMVMVFMVIIEKFDNDIIFCDYDTIIYVLTYKNTFIYHIN